VSCNTSTPFNAFSSSKSGRGFQREVGRRTGLDCVSAFAGASADRPEMFRLVSHKLVVASPVVRRKLRRDIRIGVIFCNLDGIVNV
jgi:hypothetical protein